MWGERSGPGTTAVGMALEVLAHSGGFRKPVERVHLEGPFRLLPAATNQGVLEGRGRSWLVGWTGSWVRVGATSALWMGKASPLPWVCSQHHPVWARGELWMRLSLVPGQQGPTS